MSHILTVLSFLILFGQVEQAVNLAKEMRTKLQETGPGA